MTATPLRDSSPAHKLVTLAARRAGKLTDEQRATLDQKAAALVEKAGDLANAALIVANFTLSEFAAATLSAFSAAVQAFTVSPLPPVREGDDEVEQPIVFHLMRMALDLGTDASVIVADVDKVIALYRFAFFAAGAGRDLPMVEALPESICEDVSSHDVVDCYNQLSYEHHFRYRRARALRCLPECKMHPSGDKEMQVQDLGDVLLAIACARAGSAEVLATMFDLGKLDDLMHECDLAVGAAGVTRSTAVLERMVKLMPETPGGNVVSSAETLDDFRHLATARPVKSVSRGEDVF